MRAQAQNNYKIQKARNDVEQNYNQHMERLSAELKGGSTVALNKQQELGKQHEKELKDLDDQQKELKDRIESASVDNIAWGYWRECLFPIGAIILVGGLVAVSMLGVGAERIISMVMLSIITFSIFIGGSAWLSSIVNNVLSAASQVKHAF